MITISDGLCGAVLRVLGAGHIWVQKPVLPTPGCVTLEKTLNLSEPQYHHM